MVKLELKFKSLWFHGLFTYVTLPPRLRRIHTSSWVNLLCDLVYYLVISWGLNIFTTYKHHCPFRQNNENDCVDVVWWISYIWFFSNRDALCHQQKLQVHSVQGTGQEKERIKRFNTEAQSWLPRCLDIFRNCVRQHTRWRRTQLVSIKGHECNSFQGPGALSWMLAPITPVWPAQYL